MGFQLALTGIVFIITAIVVIKLSVDDVTQVPELIKWFVGISFMAVFKSNGAALTRLAV